MSKQTTWVSVDYDEIDFDEIDEKIYQYQQLSKFFEVDPENLFSIKEEILAWSYTSSLSPLISSKNKVSNGSNLAGQLEQEIIIPIELLKENNLYDFFTDNLKEYLSQIIGKEPLENNVDVNLTDMWVAFKKIQQ